MLEYAFCGAHSSESPLVLKRCCTCRVLARSPCWTCRLWLCTCCLWLLHVQQLLHVLHVLTVLPVAAARAARAARAD